MYVCVYVREYVYQLCLKDSSRQRRLEAGAVFWGHLTACLWAFKALCRIHYWVPFWSVRGFSQPTVEKLLEDFCIIGVCVKT